MMCSASCACGGQLQAVYCPMLPGCSACAGTNLIVVRFTPVYLEPKETLSQRIHRDDMISQMPGYSQQPRMN